MRGPRRPLMEATCGTGRPSSKKRETGRRGSPSTCDSVVTDGSSRGFVNRGAGPEGQSVQDLVAGAPDTIRTCDLCLRRATLYPAELRVQRVSFSRLARGRQPRAGRRSAGRSGRRGDAGTSPIRAAGRVVVAWDRGIAVPALGQATAAAGTSLGPNSLRTSAAAFGALNR